MTPPSPLHARLRAATAELHARLDGSLVIARQPPTAERVTRHLRACAGFYAPLEQRVEAVAQASPELRALALHERGKLDWLRTDLAQLGASSDTDRCDDLPPVERPDDCWGLLYVLEGATLGGRVLESRIGAAAPDLPPLRFFTGYGPETAVRWREFLTALDAADRANRIDAARAEAAACATFATFHRWLQRQGCTTA